MGYGKRVRNIRVWTCHDDWDGVRVRIGTTVLQYEAHDAADAIRRARNIRRQLVRLYRGRS